MKEKIFSLGILLLCITMLSGTFSGCTPSSSGGPASSSPSSATAVAGKQAVTNVTFWYSMGGLGEKALQKMINDFNSSQSDIHVDAKYEGSYTDAMNKLKNSIKGGQLPDVVQLGDESTRFMMENKSVLPLQNLIDAEKYDLSTLEPNILAFYSLGGKLYSMPFNNSTPILYYNKDLFRAAGLDPENPPKTMDELIAAGKKISKKDAKGNLQVSGCEINNSDINEWLFSEWMCLQGLPFANNDNGRSQRSTAVAYDQNGGGLKILQKLLEVQKSGTASSAKTINDIFGRFASGQSAMMLSSSAGLYTVLTTIGSTFEVGTGPMPSISAGDKGGISVGGAALWMMDTKDSDRQKAAFEFIKFMASPEQQAYWCGQTGYFPVTTKSYDLPEMKQLLSEKPQFKAAIDQLHKSSPQNQGVLIGTFPELTQQYEDMINKVLSGEWTPEEGIKNAAGQANKTIAEYNENNPLD